MQAPSDILRVDLFDAHRHLAGEIGVLIEEVRERRARYAEHLRRGGDRQPLRLDDLGPDEVAGVNRINHTYAGNATRKPVAAGSYTGVAFARSWKGNQKSGSRRNRVRIARNFGQAQGG